MTQPIIQGPYRTFRRLIEEESFLEFEGSTITIPMRGRDANSGWLEEEIKLNAFMRLEIFPAYYNNLGTREFQFIIRDWYLYGKSPLLNRLFFDDPRGRYVEKLGDYVPAVVTFNVSNNYDVRVDQDGLVAEEVFGPSKELQIHGLTSQHLRSWVDMPERSPSPRYDLPRNMIYWTIASAGRMKGDFWGERLRGLLGKNAEAPFIVFHTKPPRHEDSADAADVGGFGSAPEDWSNHFLAIGSLPVGRESTRFVAREPEPGTPGGPLRASQVQLSSNTVISPLARPRQPLEIRWSLAKSERLQAALKDGARLSGAIRIVSPSRSLGTADQRPDVGEPFDSADFPARITYATNYDIAINELAFVEDQAGIAIAMGAEEIPPRDVTVAFDKPHIGHVLQRFLEFGSGHCTGMHEITQDEYLHNVNFARFWRTVPLRDVTPADAARWNDFKDFDPTHEY